MLILGKLTQKELLKLLVDINLKVEANKNLEVSDVIQVIVDRLRHYDVSDSCKITDNEDFKFLNDSI